MNRACKSCGMEQPETLFPVAYHYRQRPYRRWKCRPCCAQDAADRRRGQ